MTIALATSWIDAPEPGVAGHWLEAARTLHVRALFAHRIPAQAVATGKALRAGGVTVVGVAVPFEQLAELESQVVAAAALRASALVVDGGPAGRHRAGMQAATAVSEARAFAGRSENEADAETLRVAQEDRSADRAARTEALLRRLHPVARAGVPLALRNAHGFDQLLDLEEATWVFDELPGLGLCFDAADAVRAERAGWGASLDDWLDAHAGRMTAVVATGLGRDRAGRRHPEDGPLPWSILSARVPRAAPWIFDPATDLGEDEVQDALRALRALRR